MKEKVSASSALSPATRQHAHRAATSQDTMSIEDRPERLDPEAFAYLMVFGTSTSADDFLDALCPSKRGKG